MDLSPILSKLDAVRRRVRALIMIDGVSRAALVLFAAAIFSFCIDFFIPKVPIEVRVTVLLAGIAAVGVAAWRYVFTPLSIGLSDDDLALCVEKQYPELNDRLISALQLSRADDAFSRFNSPELVDRLVTEAKRESDALDFNPVVLPGGPYKLAGWTAGAAALLAMVGAFNMGVVKIWAARLFSDSVSWPRQTQIVILNPQGNPITLAKGDDMEVEIETRGQIPRKAMISYRFAKDGDVIQRPMRAETNGRWAFEFTKVIEPLEFWVEAGDDETLPVAVQVLNPPTVERISVVYDYPDYTRLADTDPAKPSVDGNLVAPMGTKVQLSAFTNLDVSKAKIQFGRRGEEETQDLVVANDSEGRPRLVQVKIDVLKNTQYAIWLQATNGLQTTSPVRYAIKATDDKAPELKVLEPNLDKFCTANALIPIRISTTDDFGVTALVLMVKTNVAGKGEVAIPMDPWNTESYPAKKLDTDYVFDMAAFGAKEGMIIEYQIVATDGREVPQANVTKTRVYRFTVIKRDEMLKKMEDMLARIRDEIRRILGLQEGSRADTARLMDVLGVRDLLEMAERQAMNGAGANQRRITQHLDRITHEFDEIVKDMRHNKLFEGQGEDKLRKPGDILHAVTEIKSPEVAGTLLSAASVAQGKDRNSRLGDAAAKQDEIIGDLNTVLGMLEEYETYMEVVRFVREMLQKAERLKTDLENAPGK